MSVQQWGYGDRVVLVQRPEWGTGVVTAAERVSHNGTPCQRLTVRFDRVGVKTLSTGIAQLAAAPATSIYIAQMDSIPQQAVASGREQNGRARDVNGSDDGSKGWLDALAAPSPKERLLKLPENTSDPFTSLQARLEATLSLYRFSEQGGSLLDWAASLLGVTDPLTIFNRHELEQIFQRFKMLREEHLKKLVLEARKRDPQAVAAAFAKAPASVQQVLKRLDIGR